MVFFKEIQVLLILFKWNFIAFLIFSILCTLFLNRIIGQMDILIIDIFILVLSTWSSQICIMIKICIDARVSDQKDKASDIEFSTVKQCWGDIFLDYVSSLFIFFVVFLNVLFHLFQLSKYFYAISSVRLLARLQHPHSFQFFCLWEILILRNYLSKIFLQIFLDNMEG